ncbi:glycoside hydrolase family 36 protein [Paenibacillus aestuarii]|uniref:Glycoside hydrolase family 36 protein n=1 Tax=Paenibacillus aestuarii TaxID=516965 RepID=A0ABW0K7C1_9BACL|nr:glycoside hydrolase family 36 protein [Paenibacillus aestuarii]
MKSMTVTTESHLFTLTVPDERFQVALTAEQKQPGVALIHIALKAETAQEPPHVTLQFVHPAADIHASWHPAHDRNKSFKADWMRTLRANAASSAPVYALFNALSRNRLTFAFSDALNTVHYAGGIREETAEFHCRLELFKEELAPLTVYNGTLLVDTRDVPYYEALQGVQAWWNALPHYAAAYVPEAALSPMYSTWYNMHQNVTSALIEEECRLAKSLGMEAVIIDDGWQTADNRRGYAYTGDWEPEPGKFPDMRSHVETIHELGMKVMLWYSVPHIGKHSQAWKRFADKLLRFNEGHGAGILDPRYPEVRDYIIGKYEQAVKEWNLDGFKLDFIDTFYSPELQTSSTTPGRDLASIPEAVDRLMTDSILRLRAIKPDILVEFRQPYIGPAMRKYGNMFRASDCPNDSIQNRVRILDIRLICGQTAAHSDMMMWHESDPLESAALQLINSLFGVPQISVLLAKLPQEQLRMLRYWLAFWRDNRDILLAGELAPANPELLYPLVRASLGSRVLIAVYYDTVVPLHASSEAEEWTLVNGRLQSGLVIEVAEPLGMVEIAYKTCCGDPVSQSVIELKAGLHKLPIPAAGTAHLRRMP